jgi:hypothetical protein
MKKLAAALGTAAMLLSPFTSFAAINSLGGLTGGTQTFATSTGSLSPHLLIQSSGTTHTFSFNGVAWPIVQGGTGATSFATGSIPFINNGVFAENNSQLFWDAVNNIFNVGGSTTSAKFFVKGSGTLNLFTLANASGTQMFSVGRTGTTTAANGFNITAGCFAKNGVCLTTGSGSGTVSSSTQGFIAYYPLNGSTVAGNSSIFINSVQGKIGFNTNSPQATVDINGAYYSRLVTATSSVIDWDLGNVQQLTLTSSPTLTLNAGHAGGKYDLILTQDGTGSRTVIWPASVKWPSGTAPTLSTAPGAVDTISFIFDGTNYLGIYSLNYSIPSAGPTLTTNLVSYWKFDEASTSGSAADSAGSNTLTNVNSATFSTGKINNAANMVHSSSQYFSIADGSQTGLDITGDMTINAWVNFPTPLAASEVIGFVSKCDNSSRAWCSIFSNNGSNDTFTLAVSSNGTSNSQDTVVFSSPFATGTWYMLTVVYHASAGTFNVYRNGSLEGTGTGLFNSIFSGTAEFRVGWDNNPSPTDGFNGSMDEVGIWSRALSGSEVSQLYNSGSGIQYPF